MTSVAVLLTTHERRDITLACLDAVVSQQMEAGTSVSVVLVDAGSSDGTAAAVRASHPDVDVLERGPELFWNAGMREAFAHAYAARHDHYLWLNDDTRLDADALGRLLETNAAVPGLTITVGATRDPHSGLPTYGGVQRGDRRRPLRFERVPPTDRVEAVETFNGNCVLIPHAVAERVGNLSPAFSHGMGDFDYGLRARRRGIQSWMTPGTVGTCARNAPTGPRSVRAELDALTGPKGLPPQEWAAFARRWGGPLWPVYFASPYVRRVTRRFVEELKDPS